MEYVEFVQRVRRYRRSNVLEGCAAASVLLTHREFGRGVELPFGSAVRYFSLAGVAMAAVVHGNEHRNAELTVAGLEQLCANFIEVDEPFGVDPTGPDAVRNFLVRTAFDQQQWQFQPGQEIGRVQAMLGDAVDLTGGGVITPAFWDAALGCSLTEFVGVAQILHTGAAMNAGRFDLGWLDQSNLDPITAEIPRDVIEMVARRHFLGDPAQFRAIADAPAHQVDQLLRRYQFNPLILFPYICQPDATYIAPVAAAVLRRATTESLYYAGVGHASTRFTDALGPVFEAYVGRQLELLEPELLTGEVEYEPGKLSADWVVVLPEAVIIIEAKATPLTAESRRGGDSLDADLERAPGKAVEQILATAGLIRQGHEGFEDVPTDRPIIGLIATLHPYYTCHTDLVWRRTPTDTPILLASVSELETLVTIQDNTAGNLLRTVADGPEPASLGWALTHENFGPNKVLREAWKHYPFAGHIKSVD